MDALAPLAPFLEQGRDAVYTGFAVLTRVGAAVSMLPGFGEVMLSPRVKLAAAVAFTMVVAPAVMPMARLDGSDMTTVGYVFAAEAVAGLLIGLSLRLLLLALQTAGAVASQSTSLAQIFGPSVTGDQAPPYASVLAIGGVALAFALGLPAYVAAGLIGSYDTIPFGTFPFGADVASWGVSKVAQGFATATSLAAPFIIGAVAYNAAIGAINRAMPQLMVAFIGAPAIVAGSLLLMALCTPLILRVWGVAFESAMADPFGPPR